MKAKVAVFGTLRFPPENIEKVLPHLKTLVSSTYANDGCIAVSYTHLTLPTTPYV